MTKKRKSFILHLDSLAVLDEISDEQAGLLFKAIYNYQKNDTHDLNGLLNAVFIPFKNQFDRDDEKYKSVCERNRINGLKGGRPETQKTQSVNLGTHSNPLEPKQPDNKNDNDSKNKKEESIYGDFEIFWKNYPKQRIGRKDKARIAYKNALTRDEEGNIMFGLEAYAKSDEVSRGFAKGAAAWLNDDRWTTDYTTPTKGNGNGTHTETSRKSKSQRAKEALQRAVSDTQGGEVLAIGSNPRTVL